MGIVNSARIARDSITYSGVGGGGFNNGVIETSMPGRSLTASEACFRSRAVMLRRSSFP